MVKATEKPKQLEPGVKKTKQGEKRKQKNFELKKKYLQYFINLPVQKLAASWIGRDEDTIINWRKEDKSFSDQVEAAKSAWALKTSGTVKNSEWLLERVMREHFGVKTDPNANSAVDKFFDRISKMFPD